MIDDKFRSRRWMLARDILLYSRLFALVVLIIGVFVPDAKEHIGSIITGVLAFLGTVHALVYGAYTANHAFTGKDNRNKNNV